MDIFKNKMMLFQNYEPEYFFVLLIIGSCYGTIIIPKYVAPWPKDSASPNVSAVADSNWNTQWTAWPCRAGGWRGNSVQIIMLNACARGYCSQSCSMVQDSQLASATDNNGYTGGFVPMSHEDGKAWVIFPFQNGPKIVTKFFVRGIWPATPQDAKDGTSGMALRDGIRADGYWHQPRIR